MRLRSKLGHRCLQETQGTLPDKDSSHFSRPSSGSPPRAETPDRHLRQHRETQELEGRHSMRPMGRLRVGETDIESTDSDRPSGRFGRYITDVSGPALEDQRDQNSKQDVVLTKDIGPVKHWMIRCTTDELQSDGRRMCVQQTHDDAIHQWLISQDRHHLSPRYCNHQRTNHRNGIQSSRHLRQNE